MADPEREDFEFELTFIKSKHCFLEFENIVKTLKQFNSNGL